MKDRDITKTNDPFWIFFKICKIYFINDTDRPFGQTAYEIIRDTIAEYDYPVCFDFPVSHEKENYALKIGVGYKLKVGKNKVTLEE